MKQFFKICVFAIISLAFTYEAKAQYDIAFSNSTSCTWNLTIYDNFGNNIFSVNPPPAGQPGSSQQVRCFTGAAPSYMIFTQGACSYTLNVNASGSCSTCLTCPCFSGVTFTNTYNASSGGFGGCPGPDGLISISW
jgi:hypothetical protein